MKLFCKEMCQLKNKYNIFYEKVHFHCEWMENIFRFFYIINSTENENLWEYNVMAEMHRFLQKY